MPRRSKTENTRQPTQVTHRQIRVNRFMYKLWTDLQGLRASLPVLAAAWLVFVLLELLLTASISGSVIHRDQIPLGARLLLICYSFTVLAFFLITMRGSIGLMAWASERFLPAWVASRWMTHGLTMFLLWLILLLYGTSWAMFWQIGNFLDHRAFVFLAPHPVQVFHWVDTDVIVALVLSTLVLTGVLKRWLPRWIEGWRPTAQRRLVLICTWLVSACIAGAFFGETYRSWGTRRNAASATLYVESRDHHLGPFAYVLTNIRRRFLSQPVRARGGNEIQIVRRPIISMKQYLDSISPRNINRWNVIILIVESLRADQLRIYGSGRDVMPAVEALTRESRVFAHTYSTSSHSDYASPVPLSSHYPLRSATTYTYPEKFTYPRVMIYDVLKPLGYQTAIFSSSNEYWGGMFNYLQTGNLDRFFHAATFKGPTYVSPGDTGLADWVRKTKHAGSVDDRFTVSEAIQWIDALNTEPFFLSMNFQNSHLPYVVPRDFQRRFSPDKLDFTIRFGHFPQNKAHIVKDVYADSLAYVDSQIARLFEHLKRRGIWDRTVVVLTGDHGQAFYEHGFAAHASAIMNEVMKVPLVIRVPGLQPRVESRPAQHIDIAPSVLDLLRLPPHPSFQGISLFDPQSNPNRSLYMVAQNALAYHYGIVRSGVKLIYDEGQQQYWLFDLTSDPTENNSIARSKPDVVKELAKRLHTWREVQIDYYTDEALHRREYPPILLD